MSGDPTDSHFHLDLGLDDLDFFPTDTIVKDFPSEKSIRIEQTSSGWEV